MRKPSTSDALIGYFTPSHVIHQRLLLQFLSTPEGIIAVANKHTVKLHHVGFLYILTFDARKLKHKMLVIYCPDKLIYQRVQLPCLTTISTESHALILSYTDQHSLSLTVFLTKCEVNHPNAMNLPTYPSSIPLIWPRTMDQR